MGGGRRNAAATTTAVPIIIILLLLSQYKESLKSANSDHLDKTGKSKREWDIRKAFTENHLNIVLVNFVVMITKTCKSGNVLSK